jgi:hypothetical protein
MCLDRSKIWVVALVVAACAAGCRNSSTSRDGGVVGGPPAVPPPSMFVSEIDNPFFPLFPGTMFLYEGTTDEGDLQTFTYVTFETETVMGVTCTVVRSTEFVDGALLEETDDWYAQDVDGNVWYFGEDTQEYDEYGFPLPVTGSWRAGVDGAQPGIAMPGDPNVGDPAYYQEYYPGVAEDMAIVESLDDTATVPFGTFQDCLRTHEFSPLDPTEKVLKYYATGIGHVLETDLDGDPLQELVDVLLAF